MAFWFEPVKVNEQFSTRMRSRPPEISLPMATPPEAPPQLVNVQFRMVTSVVGMLTWAPRMPRPDFIAISSSPEPKWQPSISTRAQESGSQPSELDCEPLVVTPETVTSWQYVGWMFQIF